MNIKKKKIIILGGGSAGWMAANLFAHEWKEFEIKVIESSAIGIIGVGEGSTPLLKTFFERLGIDEREWMPRCNATYKLGIRFVNWSTRPGYENYFHPFDTCLDNRTMPAFKHLTKLRRGLGNVKAHPDRFFLTTKLAAKGLSPKPNPNFPFNIGHGYHFDAGLLGEFLKEKAIEAGVGHEDTLITDVRINEQGDIANLVDDEGNCIDGDLFVDCSGFKGVLIRKALKAKFKTFEENLFNDSAIAIPTEISSRIPSETVSTALKNGWAWKIPLTNRFGNGYVYSSKYTTPEEAEDEFIDFLGVSKQESEIRHLKMSVGRLEKSWVKNCVAIGLSQGFVEPLEATALHFIQSSIQKFIEAYEKGSFTNQNQESYNQAITFDFERIRDYIVLHYNTNTRFDTQYWLDNQRNPKISSYLDEMINSWLKSESLESKLKELQIERYYQPISWYSLFAGMGVYPDGPLSNAKLNFDIKKIDDFLENCSLNFKAHKAELNALTHKG